MSDTPFTAFAGKNNYNDNSRIGYDTASLIESYLEIYLPRKNNSDRKCYINVMNNHELPAYTNKQGEIIDDYKNMYIRKEHGYAHIAVTYYKRNAGENFRDFDERQYFYVTKIQNNNVLQIRADLAEKWGAMDATNISVLAIDTDKSRVIDVPVKVLLSMKHTVKQSENLDFLFIYDIPEDSLIWVNVSENVNDEKIKALMAQWQYLGHVKYNKSEARTHIKIISYDIDTKKKRKTLECKSMKQAYEFIEQQGIDMSYKTFQRRCKAEKPSLIETEKFTFYVTDKIDFDGPETI